MQPIEALRTIQKTWWPYVILVSVLVVVMPICSVPISAEEQTENTDGIQILADQKKEMEQQAFILVGLKEEEDITQEEYEAGQRLYGKAQTAMDTLIAQLQQALQEGKDLESSKEYQAALREAASSSEVFREYVHEKFLGNPRGKVADRTRKVLDAIQEAARLIWAAATDSQDATSEQKLAQDLEGEKLTSFAQIEAKK